MSGKNHYAGSPEPSESVHTVRAAAMRSVREQRFAAAFPTQASREAYLVSCIEACKR